MLDQYFLFLEALIKMSLRLCLDTYYVFLRNRFIQAMEILFITTMFTYKSNASVRVLLWRQNIAVSLRGEILMTVSLRPGSALMEKEEKQNRNSGAVLPGPLSSFLSGA